MPLTYSYSLEPQYSLAARGSMPVAQFTPGGFAGYVNGMIKESV